MCPLYHPLIFSSRYQNEGNQVLKASCVLANFDRTYFGQKLAERTKVAISGIIVGAAALEMWLGKNSLVVLHFKGAGNYKAIKI